MKCAKKLSIMKEKMKDEWLEKRLETFSCRNGGVGKKAVWGAVCDFH